MEIRDTIREEEIYALAEEVTIGARIIAEERFDYYLKGNMDDVTFRDLLLRATARNVANSVRERILSTDVLRFVENGPGGTVSADVVFMSSARFLGSIRRAVRRLLDKNRTVTMDRIPDNEGDCSLCGGAKMVFRFGKWITCPLCEGKGTRIPREDLEKELVMYRERHMEGKKI